MCTLTYDVSYRLVGDTGLSRVAVVIVDEANIGDIDIAVKLVLSINLNVPVKNITNVYPVMLKAGSIVVVRDWA